MGRRNVGTDDLTQSLVNKARAAGWHVTITGGNHLRFVPPDPAKPIVIGSLSGSKAAARDTRSRLRRSGLDC